MASTEDNLQQQEDGILSTLLPALSRVDRFLEGAVREVQFSNGLNVASSIQGLFIGRDQIDRLLTQSLKKYVELHGPLR